LIGAVMFAFGGSLIARMDGQIQVFWALCWLPLMLLFYQRSLEAAKRPNKYTYLASIIFSVVILSGQHYVFIFDGLTIFLFTIFAYVKKVSKEFIMSSVVNLLFIIAVSGLLSAVFILPSYELAGLSYRWIGSPNDPVRALAKISYADTCRYSGTCENILSFFERTWETMSVNAYIGVLSVFFLGIAFAKRSRDQAFYWATLFLFGLASLGNKTFVHYALYLVIPMFDKIRTAFILLYPAIFCLICLVCYGIDEFAKVDMKARLSKFGRKGIVNDIGASIIVILIVGFLLSNHKLFEISMIASGFIFLLSMAAILILKLVKPAYDIRVVILILICIDLFAFFNSGIPKVEDKTNTNWFKDDAIIYNIIKSGPNNGTFRIFAPDDILPRNFGEVYKMNNFEGYGALMLVDFYNDRGYPHEREDNKMFDLMSVKYHVSDKILNNMQGYKFLKKVNGKYLYENTLYFPKFFIIKDVNYIIGNASSADVKRKIIPVNKYAVKPNKIEMTYSAQQPSNLVVSENYYPGWQAFVDGRNVRINKFRNIMYVNVPVGEHNVVMVFRPFKFYFGAWISIVTLFSVCYLIFKDGQRKRKA
jgi:hypothetical protein